MCRWCPNPQLEEPEFNLETTERLLHNLVLKILEYCYGVHIQPSNLLEVVVDALVAGPQDSALCEGCQLGVCSKAKLATVSDAWKPLKGMDKTSTHRTPKHQNTRPYATPTHHSSTVNNNFPWKHCCWISITVICIFAVVLFSLLYFTIL